MVTILETRQLKLLPPMPRFCNTLTACFPIRYASGGIVATKIKKLLLYFEVFNLSTPSDRFLPDSLSSHFSIKNHPFELKINVF